MRIGGGGDACRPASDASAICCDAATGSVRTAFVDGRGLPRGWAARAGEGGARRPARARSRRSTGTEVTERPSTCGGGRSGALRWLALRSRQKAHKVAGRQAAYQVRGASPRAPPLPRAAAALQALQRLRGREKQRARARQALRRRDSRAAIRRAPPQLLRRRLRSQRRGGTRSLHRAQPSARRRADPQRCCAPQTPPLHLYLFPQLPPCARGERGAV